jgi:hypothetical protein
MRSCQPSYQVWRSMSSSVIEVVALKCSSNPFLYLLNVLEILSSNLVCMSLVQISHPCRLRFLPCVFVTEGSTLVWMDAYQYLIADMMGGPRMRIC